MKYCIAYPLVTWLFERENRQSAIRVSEAVAMTTQRQAHTNVVNFDTDSHAIGLDNRCSACISNRIEDFDGPVTKTDKTIKAFAGGRVSNVYTGTIVWKWMSDEGKRFKFHIPHSYYVPDGGCRLLSPQHWAKTQHKVASEGTSFGETTLQDKSVLFWGENKLTIPLGNDNNVATFTTAPGYDKYDLFCQKAEFTKDEEITHPMTINDTEIQEIEDDDAEIKWMKAPNTKLWSEVSGLPISRRQAMKEEAEKVRRNNNIRLDLTGIGQRNDSKPDVGQAKSAELLMYHIRMGHIGFGKLREMARQGIIPGYLQHCPTPACSACMCGKATRNPWRHKTRRDWRKNAATCPGEVISVDQMVSPTPGLVAQMSGRLTKERYKYATIYVDTYSGYSYVNLQKTQSISETIEGKTAFEALCEQHGVRVRSYHADNGIFRAKEWTTDCKAKNQGLTFTGVNAHHSNGRAERRIRLLQDLSRSMLIYADRRWGGGAMVHLWPYAMRMANESVNNSPNMQDKFKRTPMDIMFNTYVQMNVKYWYPFA